MLEGELGVITLTHEVVASLLRATGELYTDVLGCYLDGTLAGAVSADSGRGQTFQIADEKPQPPTKPPDEDEAQITVLQRAIHQAIHPSSLACVGDDLVKDSWALSTVALHFFPEVSRKVAKVEDVTVLKESLTAITSSLASLNWWKHSPQPLEHALGPSIDAMVIIGHVIKVLEIVDPTSDAISSIQTLQASCAKLMVGQSNATESPLEWPMAAADINQLRFDSSLNSFGELVATTIRKPIRMSTINFVSDADLDEVPWFRPLLTSEAFVSHAKIVVNARNGLFHGNHRPDYHKVYGSMLAIKEMLLALDTSEGCRSLDWEPPVVLPDSSDTSIRIVRSGVPKLDHPFVGRIEQASAIAALLETPKTRLLLYGPAGVGKAVLVTLVANQLRSQLKGTLILEADARDDSTFLHSIVVAFVQTRPEVVQGILYNTDAAYSAITKHLQETSDWVICVRKATRGTALLWKLIESAHPDGRVVVAGRHKSLLMKEYTPSRFNKIDGLLLDNHMAIFQQLDVFGGKEVTLNLAELEGDLLKRCTNQNATHCYIPPPDEGETELALETRRLKIERRLLEHQASGPLQTLVRTRLKQPRSVVLLGLILRSEPALLSVADLSHRHREGSAKVEVDGFERNQFQDETYIRLSLIVGPILDTLREAMRCNEEGAHGALVLLGVLAVLSRAETPVSLLEGGLSGLPTRAAVDRARIVCAQHGLIRLPQQPPANPDDERVGVMDPYVQRYLQFALVAGSSLGRELIPALRKRLLDKFSYSRDVSPSDWPKLKRLESCVSEWCLLALGGVEGPAIPTKTPRPVEGTVDDTYLLSRLGEMKVAVDFDSPGAVVIFRRVLTSRRRFLRLNHPQVAVSAYNLAAAYSVEKSRHSDARKLLAEAMSFRTQGLMAESDEVKTSMAVTMATVDLGPLSVDAPPRNVEQALRLEKLSVDLVRSEVKDEAPIVARAVSRLGRLHAAIGEHDKALDLHREALKLRLSCFGEDNLQVAESHACIAASLAAMDQFDESLVAWQEALKIRKLWLTEERPEVESTVSSVISALNVVGRKDDARAMLLQVLNRKNANRAKDNTAAPTAEPEKPKSKPPPAAGAKDRDAGASGATRPPQPRPQPTPRGDSFSAAAAAPEKASKGKKGSTGGGFMCASCRKRGTEFKAMQVCDGCKRVHYCSRKCQKKHWVDGGHKRFCKTLAERGTISVEAAEAAAEEGDPVHPCPICLTNEDDSGSAGMCYACGSLFCGECNQPNKIGSLPCPTCRYPLPTVSDHGRVELLHKLLKRSPGRHTAPALHLLGNAYANAQGTAQDLERALDLYQKAADLKSLEATITLGVCFERGEGTEEDHEEAVRLYRLAASHRKAQFNLGNCFFVGNGVELNRTIAFQWFKRAADQGYADAQLCVGSCYERGAGVKLDQSKAFEWFKKSADQGNIKAQHSVASSLLHGLGVPQDVAKAVAAFEIPAMRGHPMSQFNLGVILYKGREGVAQDLPKAIDWLRKAADQKHPGAQFNLGSAYSTGTGVAKDLPEAARLFALAADQGHELAKRYLRSLLANHPDLRQRRPTPPPYPEAPQPDVREAPPITGDSGNWSGDSDAVQGAPNTPGPSGESPRVSVVGREAGQSSAGPGDPNASETQGASDAPPRPDDPDSGFTETSGDPG
eukprot:m.415201 g.415201  ORF g.415201 m.415201 type:complete len:1655 (+) comp16823_c0_seq80:4298-9262(+)